MQTRLSSGATQSGQTTSTEQMQSTRISQNTWRAALIGPLRRLREQAAAEDLDEEAAAEKYGLLTSKELSEKRRCANRMLSLVALSLYNRPLSLLW